LKDVPVTTDSPMVGTPDDFEQGSFRIIDATIESAYLLINVMARALRGAAPAFAQPRDRSGGSPRPRPIDGRSQRPYPWPTRPLSAIVARKTWLRDRLKGETSPRAGSTRAEVCGRAMGWRSGPGGGDGPNSALFGGDQDDQVATIRAGTRTRTRD
jgi:hypothetical protein